MEYSVIETIYDVNVSFCLSHQEWSRFEKSYEWEQLKKFVDYLRNNDDRIQMPESAELKDAKDAIKYLASIVINGKACGKTPDLLIDLFET